MHSCSFLSALFLKEVEFVAGYGEVCNLQEFGNLVDIPSQSVITSHSLNHDVNA